MVSFSTPPPPPLVEVPALPKKLTQAAWQRLSPSSKAKASQPRLTKPIPKPHPIQPPIAEPAIKKVKLEPPKIKPIWQLRQRVKEEQQDCYMRH